MTNREPTSEPTEGEPASVDAQALSGPAPVSPNERHRSLDVLRGFALMGIFIVNIQAMAMVGAAYSNPTVYGDFTGLNWWSFAVTYLFFESKMMAIFSMLFGAGILLMFDRNIKGKGTPLKRHVLRMGWLLLFGLMHAHLIWFGDILFPYAVCGVIFYFVKGLPARWMFVISGFLILVPVGISFLLDVMMSYSPELRTEMAHGWSPPQSEIDAETNAYRGTWLRDQMPKRVRTALVFEVMLLPLMFFWRIGGLILIGMGLYKTGVLTGQRSSRFYLVMASSGLSVGWLGAAAALSTCTALDWEVESMFWGIQVNVVTSVFAALGYVGLIILLVKHNIFDWLQHAFASAGRMALTNYIMQSLIGTFLFYGHGLGWFGSVSRTEMVGIVVAVWAFQLTFSPLWLSKFRFGPLEWTWRSLAYWKKQPML